MKIPVICCYCGAHMGEIEAPAFPPSTKNPASHGVCSPCAAREMSRLDRKDAEQRAAREKAVNESIREKQRAAAAAPIKAPRFRIRLNGVPLAVIAATSTINAVEIWQKSPVVSGAFGPLPLGYEIPADATISAERI